jgi:phage/plasmid primase-like uncharacterized protein
MSANENENKVGPNGKTPPRDGNGTGLQESANAKRTHKNNKSAGNGNGHTTLIIEELFRAAIETKLGFAPEEIIADGEINRFGEISDSEGPCWYVLHADDPAPYGIFGDWRTGEKHHWRGQRTRPLTPEERAEQDKRRAERNNEHLRLQRAAAREAQKLEAKCDGWVVRTEFPYLARKNVGAHRPMFQPEEYKIAIPVREDGEKTVSLQFIRSTGDKWFLENGKISGCWFKIGNPYDAPDSPIVIVEGYATGATIYETTGFPVIVAFNAGNLEAVAKNIAKKYPGAAIVIAGDDDLKTERNSKAHKNTGVEKAKMAAAAVNGVAVFPPFNRDKEGIEPSDWNDFAALRGKDNVGAIFLEAIEQAKQIPQPDSIDDGNGGEDVLPPGDEDIPSPGDTPPDGKAEKIQFCDFVSFLPSHNYIYIPTREHWPAGSVNAVLPPVHMGFDNKNNPIYKPASHWLDKNSAVEQMLWSPGEPMLVSDKLLLDGGWLEKKGAKAFNSYQPPIIKPSDASKAGRWIELWHKLYPTEADHIIKYLAFKIQRPGVKINHGLLLGGEGGIGKDTLLEPVKHGVGPWNFAEISPTAIGGDFDGYKKCVMLRISEARDLGELSRYDFYEHMKTLLATPPDVLRVNEKHTKEYYVLNCCGVVITTNHKDGMYLPSGDRRVLVAWSNVLETDFLENFWKDFWDWYNKEGGIAHVVAYLRELDVSDFNPKAPPPKTAAFWDMVNAGRAPETGQLSDLLEAMENPRAVTIKGMADHRDWKETDHSEIREYLREKKNYRNILHRLAECGYSPVRNDGAKDGLWKINGARQVVYAKKELTERERIEAAQKLME